MQKPKLEKIAPSFGSSFIVRKFEKRCKNKAPVWHFHPELEVVYVKGGSGKRHIGNHLSYFQNGDLVFLGANLPHIGFTDRLTGNESEVVVQMRSDFLGKEFLKLPEMQPIQQLFERAKMGIVFSGEDKNTIGKALEGLADLDNYDRLLHLLAILKQMAHSSEYQLLNVQDYAIEVNLRENDRISLVYSFVSENFQRTIPLEEIAGVINMTVPAFCRYFKKQSGKTFTQFVNEMRIIHACKLLSETAESITEVAFESGYANFSHFNKVFKKITGKKPSEYRDDFLQIIK